MAASGSCGPSVAPEENLNSLAYIELLKEYLIPEIKAAGAPMTFMHDSAPCFYKFNSFLHFNIRN
jgi:hypothetical protein